MFQTNEEEMPVSMKLLADLQAADIPTGGGQLGRTVEAMLGNLVAYEAGDADIATVGVTLQQYAAVILDLALTLYAIS